MYYTLTICFYQRLLKIISFSQTYITQTIYNSLKVVQEFYFNMYKYTKLFNKRSYFTCTQFFSWISLLGKCKFLLPFGHIPAQATKRALDNCWIAGALPTNLPVDVPPLPQEKSCRQGLEAQAWRVGRCALQSMKEATPKKECNMKAEHFADPYAPLPASYMAVWQSTLICWVVFLNSTNMLCGSGSACYVKASLLNLTA